MSTKMRLVNAARSIPGLRNAIWQVRRSFYALQRHLFLRRPIVDGNPLIAEAIRQGKPFVAGKMGSVEALGLRSYITRVAARGRNATPPAYGAYNAHTLYLNAGVYPQSEETFDRFGAVYLDAVQHCDALAAWDVAGEAEIFGTHCKNATLVKLQSLEPYFSATPWSAALEGKRVLAVSPFAGSIAAQYARRTELWDNPQVLPAFTLLTLRAPLSAGLVPPDAPDWFTALARMQAQMDAMDYDVALIGAGAFSLPLAVHAKRKGKVAVHLGGSLQILFGIVGKRWKENANFKNFIKESWAHPTMEETPESFRNVEGGCYW